MAKSYLATNVYEAAYGRLHELYSRGDRVIVCMSGGKDSSVCCELAIMAARDTGRLPVEVVMRDEECMLSGTFEYCERLANRVDEIDFHWLIAGQPIVNVFDRINPYWWVFDDRLNPDDWVRKPPGFDRNHEMRIFDCFGHPAWLDPSDYSIDLWPGLHDPGAPNPETTPLPGRQPYRIAVKLIDAVVTLDRFPPLWDSEQLLRCIDRNGKYHPSGHSRRPEDPWVGLTTLAEEDTGPGRVWKIMGLRTQESPRRNMGLMSKGGWKRTRVNPYGIWEGTPIYDWTDGDVWKFLAEHDFNCNTGEAPIWMGDLSFRPISKVDVGDEVVGWDRDTKGRETEIASLRGRGLGGARRKLVKAKVLAVGSKIAPVVKVTMRSGRTIRCTPDHLWLHLHLDCAKNEAAERGPSGRVRRHAHQRFGNPDYFGFPLVGHSLAHVVDTVRAESADERLAGWLGAIFDGEGNIADRGSACITIYQSQIHNPDVYREIGRVLGILGFNYHELNQKTLAQHGFRLLGGTPMMLRFLQIAQPVRRHRIENAILGHRFSTPDEIVSIEPDGEDEVFWMQTTTGNYVAWGYASKNSAYSTMYRMGMPTREMRIAPPTLTTAQTSMLQMAAKAWPHWFDRVATRLNGVRTVAQFGLRAVQPYRRDDESWEQCFYREIIDPVHVPDWLKERALYVAEWAVKNHAAHSTAPFPDGAQCPTCKTQPKNWKELTKLTYGGDPFGMKLGMLEPIEPEFFREGAGTWGRGEEGGEVVGE